MFRNTIKSSNTKYSLVEFGIDKIVKIILLFLCFFVVIALVGMGYAQSWQTSSSHSITPITPLTPATATPAPPAASVAPPVTVPSLPSRLPQAANSASPSKSASASQVISFSSYVPPAVAEAPPPPSVPAPIAGSRQGEWLTLGDPLHPSMIRIPPICQVKSCPLVVVSHPRNQNAARLRDSQSFKKISNELINQNFVLLLGGDGGKSTWGSPHALRSVAKVHKQSIKKFLWNGNTHALGVSMGGLLSLRSALPNAPYEVHSVALIDAWVDLMSAWQSSATRRQEIKAAYRTQHPPINLNPIEQVLRSPYLPLFVASSVDDKVVPAMWNGERIYSHGVIGISQFMNLTGPHMGGNRFTPHVGQQIGLFFKRSERWHANLRTQNSMQVNARPSHTAP